MMLKAETAKESFQSLASNADTPSRKLVKLNKMSHQVHEDATFWWDSIKMGSTARASITVHLLICHTLIINKNFNQL